MNYITVSTTSKHKKNFLKLPDKLILGRISPNYLINDLNSLRKLINDNNSFNNIFILDVEKKQNISLYDVVDLKNKIDYKPNDLTMEAADLSILNYFENNISGKNVGIYGTGNIAFKIALRLSERNARVHIFGRKQRKIKVCIDALEQVTFDKELIHHGDKDSRLDSFVSFVSADEVISSDYNNLLKDNALCLDGGIGNFSKEFISTALENGHDVRRLDVRQSQEIMDGYINSRLNSQFSQIIGRDIINNHPVVAGGIMGQDGQVIIDRIVKPTRVIGIANGIGGVKNESDLSAEEHIKVREVQSFIEQNS
ncbi:MAG TPA: hypothetical protein DEB42_00785 [Jeotgalicoccus sp.]|nr:hypothetical protein [Jeotgalicoccus sp.]